MLTAEENDLLTKVGPGTVMGALLRRYWHPIAPVAELDERPTKQVRLLGEDLVLYRDKSGAHGLIDRYCPHRRVDLSYGIPEEHGLRCMYHGWMYNEAGWCIEQPFEETVHPGGRFKEKVRVAAYPVQSAHGLLWAYLGPQPAPLLPDWEPFSWDNTFTDISVSELPCNWLQCQENSIDPVHTQWLHAYWARHQDQLSGFDATKRHLEVGFDVFDHGIVYRRVVDGSSKEDDDWAVGRTCLFPYALFTGTDRSCHFEWRVPVDDENTLSVCWYTYRFAPGHQAPKQDRIPYWYGPIYDQDGRFLSKLTINQDVVAWVSQGRRMDRSREYLGESDRGVILMRKLLREQMEVAQDGGDPMNVFRDATNNRALKLPLHRSGRTKAVNPQAVGKFLSFQAGEPLEAVATIQASIDSWKATTGVGGAGNFG